MLKLAAFVGWACLWIVLPDPFTLWRIWRQRAWYRFKARQAVRLAATHHMAVVAKAVYSGSTEGYTLIDDLPRHENSTHVKW